ncbi:hypothetical protein BLL40_16025 [Domibacillus mangrovi]|uniref:Uncharacterized protein n=1 Tax=Domibacillus mangrovi TaxID=1714354 RepID=A0A1Q5NZ75_9BACI|nr:hypothetical protein BLL40_16025 [Domibacillus mangrovi]
MGLIFILDVFLLGQGQVGNHACIALKESIGIEKLPKWFVKLKQVYIKATSFLFMKMKQREKFCYNMSTSFVC